MSCQRRRRDRRLRNRTERRVPGEDTEGAQNARSIALIGSTLERSLSASLREDLKSSAGMIDDVLLTTLEELQPSLARVALWQALMAERRLAGAPSAALRAPVIALDLMRDLREIRAWLTVAEEQAVWASTLCGASPETTAAALGFESSHDVDEYLWLSKSAVSAQ